MDVGLELFIGKTTTHQRQQRPVLLQSLLARDQVPYAMGI
jgi:hypothetical protein